MGVAGEVELAEHAIGRQAIGEGCGRGQKLGEQHSASRAQLALVKDNKRGDIVASSCKAKDRQRSPI